MALDVMRHVWMKSKSKGSARLVLLAIADIANDAGDAFPGVGRLAKKANISEVQTKRVIRELERSGELQVFENAGMKTASGWTNLYRIVMPGIKVPIIRLHDGSIANPRPNKEKAAREFPKEDTPVNPHEDTPVNPHEDTPVNPHEDTPVNPESSVTPQIPDNTNTLSLPSGKARKADPEFDVISEVWGIRSGGWISNMQGMMFGSKKVKGEWLQCTFDPPATIREVADFEAYARKRMAEKNIADLPTAPATIQRWFDDFRAGKAHNGKPKVSAARLALEEILKIETPIRRPLDNPPYGGLTDDSD